MMIMMTMTAQLPQVGLLPRNYTHVLAVLGGPGSSAVLCGHRAAFVQALLTALRVQIMYWFQGSLHCLVCIFVALP